MKEHLHRAVNSMKQQADRKRSERKFQVGSWVFLKLQAYRQISLEKRKTDKISPRFFRPYEVLAKVGSVAYTLKLPEGSRIHPMFHVSLLKGCPNPNIVPVHPPEEMIGNRVGREPTSIADRHLVQKKGKVVTEVLVAWKNEGVEEASWEDWVKFQASFPSFSSELHP